VIRILVVDDHPVVRAGLVALLDDEQDFQVLGAAGSAEEALTLVTGLRPDILLLDLELPGLDGVAAMPDIVRRSPGIRVIVFTAYDTDERIFGALKAGASGYLLKGAPAAEIGRAIRVVHAGGSHLEARVAARVVSQVGGPRRPAPLLTEREIEVLSLVARGLSNKQIAHQLTIAESTVKFHLSTIFGRLGADNRAQAVALAVERGAI
jgi:DNA-binding NarL/FixJ family response regulator